MRRLARAFTLFCVLTISAHAAAQDEPPITKMPAVKVASTPVFPAGAQEHGVSADVMLELDIDQNGAVEAARVTSTKATAEGYDFAGSAVAAAKALVFEPAEAGGEPVPVTINYTMHFTISAIGSIGGVVLSRTTNAPVAGATVTVTAQVDGQWLRTTAQTGPDGRFQIDKLPAGHWEVRVQASGYGMGRAATTVAANQTAQVSVGLEPPTTNPYDILVEEEEANQDAGRVFQDPSKVVTLTPRVTGGVVGRAPVAVRPAAPPAPPAGGRGGRGGNGPGGGRGGGGRGGGGGPGGGRGGGGGGAGGGPGGGRGGGGGGGAGGGGFGGGRGGGGGFGGGGGGFGGGGGGAGGAGAGGAGAGGAAAGRAGTGAAGATGANAANNAAATAATTTVAASSRNNLLAYNDLDTTVTGSSGLTLRGMSPAWTSVRLDGIEIPRAFHDGAIRSALVPGILENSTLYTGNYPTEYGGSVGGLVTLSTVRDQAKQTTGYVDANLADVSAILRVPILADKLTVSGGGQFSYLDKTILWAVPRRNDVAIAWVPAYQDFSLHAVYDPSKMVHVSGLVYTSRDREIDVYANPNNATLTEPQPGTLVQDAQTYRGIVTAEVTPHPQWLAKATIGLGQDIYVQPDPAFHVQMARAEERPSVTWTPLKTLAVTLGGEIVQEKATGHVSAAAEPINAGISNPTGPTVLLAEHVARSGVVYATADWTLFKILELQPGMRLGAYSQTGEFYPEPRAVAKLTLISGKKWVDRLGLKAAAGIYRQRPSLFETDAQLGNPNLQSMLARQYLAGVEYKPIKETRIEVDAFYAQQRDVIVRTDATTTDAAGTTTNTVFDNSGYGSTRGLEVYVDQNLYEGVDGWLFYTYATSDLHQPTLATSQSPYDQTHMLGVALGFQLPLAFKLRSRFLYATGLPLTGVGTVFNASTAQYTSISGAALGQRAPDFEQLDVRLDKTFALGGGILLTAYLDVRNVLNHDNVASSYATNFDASRLYYRYGLPILPMLGARADF